MSVRVIDSVFRHSTARGSARLVLLALADVAADTGEVIAYARSHSVLAAKANVDEGTVGRVITKLIKAGELERMRVGDGRASSNYRILVGPPAGEGVQPEGPQPATPGGADRAPSPGDTPPLGVQDAPPIIPSPSVPTPSPSVGAASRSKPKHLLPDDFAVTDDMRAWAGRETPAVNVDDQTSRFVDHWTSKGERRVDWVATWRNWMRNAVDFGARPTGRARPKPRPLEPRLPLDAPQGGRVQL